ncbi:MAG: FG-GAP repeat protein [Solirubrobacteraceae bacterium]
MSVITIPSSRARVALGARHGVGRIGVQLVGVARVARARFVAAAALLCVAALALAGLTPSSVNGGRAGVGAAAGGGLAILPVAAEGPISAVLGRDLPGYRVEGLAASNPVQRFRAVFSRRGVAVVSGRMRLGLALDGYGYATAVRALAPVSPAAQANRVLYARGAVHEWWANGPAGLEQRFTVSSRPRGGSGPLTFSLGLTGDLRARLEAGGVSLVGAGGALRYGELVATDARGRALRAWFALHGRRLLVELDDRDARYPLRVDPLLAQSGELISSDGTPDGEFGGSVAVSGNTVVVGAKQQTVGSNVLQGAVYVFVEPVAGWSALGTQTAELTASDGLANDELGSSVAVSGATIVASAPGVCYEVTSSNGCQGGADPFHSCTNLCRYGWAYVFVQPAGGWSGSLTQSAELNASNQSTGVPSQLLPATFGTAVAVSGNTIVVGDDTQPAGSTINNDGAAYVFQEPAGGWSGSLTQSAELTATDGGNDNLFGDSVAVSGETIVVGAPGHGYPVLAPGTEYTQGAVYVFQQPGGGWSGSLSQSAELTAPVGAGIDELGGSVAVSGSTVAVGAPVQTVGSNLYQGAVYVYTQPVSGWSGLMTPRAELTASDGTARDSFGSSVAASGNTIAAGEELNGQSPNAVYVFAQPAAGWSGSLTQSAELRASNEALLDVFGDDAVAVSGATVIVGAPGHHRLGSTGSGQGAAYVFTCPAASSAARDQAAVAATGAGSAASGAAGDQAAVAATGAGSCPLKVFARIVGPIANVGTRSGLSVDSLYRKEGPVNFTIPTYSKTETDYADAFDVGQKCVSGCANVLVRVIDPATSDPVSGATVDATLGSLGAAKSVSGGLAGEQFLCVQSDDPSASSCGTSLSGLSTDSAGEVHLLYWAPGETAISTSSISVTAHKCSSTCSAGEQRGSAQTGVTITPYPIYQHDDGTISVAEVKSLMEVVSEGKLNNKSYAAARDQWFEVTIHWLAQQEKAAKQLVKVALGPYGYSLINLVEIGTLLAEANSGLKDEKLLSDALLEAMDMPGIGLFDDPFEKQIPAQPSDYLRQAIIHGLGNADGIGGAGGVLWDLGKALIEQYEHQRPIAVQTEHVNTTVDEISSCNTGNPNCGTGYFRSGGIRPRLCVILDFSNRVPGGDYGTHFCLSPYDPVAFATTQRVPPDQGALGAQDRDRRDQNTRS